MQPSNLFLIFTKRFDQLDVEYMITGSVASIVYGEPRMTHDVDLVVAIPKKSATELNRAFPEEQFYCPPVEVIRAELSRSQRGHFNIIHHETGYKADIYTMGSDPLHAWAWPNRRTISLGSDAFTVAPPEYVILRKLEYFREGGSQKHLDDISGILKTESVQIDTKLVREKATILGLEGAWRAIEKRTEESLR